MHFVKRILLNVAARSVLVCVHVWKAIAFVGMQLHTFCGQAKHCINGSFC